MLNQACITKPYLIIIFIYWIWYANILLKIICLCGFGGFFFVSLSDHSIRVTRSHRMSWKMFFLFLQKCRKGNNALTSSLNIKWNTPMKSSVPDVYFVEGFLKINSIPLIDIRLIHIFFFLSCVSSDKLYFSRNFLICQIYKHKVTRSILFF